MRSSSTIVSVAAIALVGCGSGGDSAPAATATAASTAAPTPPATEPEPTTTVVAATTEPQPTTTARPTKLEQLGYPVSDEWVVETVVAGIDAGTGGLAFGPDGMIYMGDWGRPDAPGVSVLRIGLDGSVETFATSDLMESMTMTTFGPDGTLYQSSFNSNRVFAIDASGNERIVAEGIRGPTGIVVRDDGTLYVESYNGDTIHEILPDGTISDFAFDRRFIGLNGLTSGPDGTLYAVDHGDGGLFAIDADGAVTTLHEFPAPTSHVVYDDGSLFITSRSSYVVYRYDLATGDIEVIAGDVEPGDRDGRGPEASFGRPNAITLGPDGALYFNHGEGTTNSPVTIRRIRHDP